MLREKPSRVDADYWALAKCVGGWRLELGWAAEKPDWQMFATSLLGGGADVETLAYHDETSGRHRFVAISGERLFGALFLARRPVEVSRSWVIEQLAADRISQRLAMLAGRPGKGEADRGATVCSCFGVGANQIAAAARNGCRSVEAIGTVLQAGTNCGSCRSEIRSIIDANRLEAAE